MTSSSNLINENLDADLASVQQNIPTDEQGFFDLVRKEKEEALKGKTQDREQRKEFATKIYWLTILWLVAVVGILLLQGFSPFEFNLSDGVLITLITGASVNIIGLMAIVIRYLFPNGKHKE